MERPKTGGSYLRQADGSLRCLESAESAPETPAPGEVDAEETAAEAETEAVQGAESP